MGECWNPGDADNPASTDKVLMDRHELRAIANYFRASHGADSFVTALEHARMLAADGDLTTAAVWNQIAEEISQIETADILQRCLERADHAAPAGTQSRPARTMDA